MRNIEIDDPRVTEPATLELYKRGSSIPGYRRILLSRGITVPPWKIRAVINGWKEPDEVLKAELEKDGLYHLIRWKIPHADSSETPENGGRVITKEGGLE